MERRHGMCLEKETERVTEEAWRGMPLLAPPPHHSLSFLLFFCFSQLGWQEGGLTSSDTDKIATAPMKHSRWKCVCMCV